MEPTLQRRSCRIAAALPIRVYGIDYRGVDFIEDAWTLVVNLHGAKIQLLHQLFPDQELRLYCHPTHKEAVFRVVGRTSEPDPRFTYWGVEALNPQRNIWGIEIPSLQPRDQTTVRVFARCPDCSTREIMNLDEPALIAAHTSGGINRGCSVCGKSGLWKMLPYGEN